jgi:lipopolysaccharide/colanic/teichoic acid biosynthesis glycosyltransferase
VDAPERAASSGVSDAVEVMIITPTASQPAKSRTMTRVVGFDAEAYRAAEDDDRVLLTRRWIRSTCAVEFPRFVNVLARVWHRRRVELGYGLRDLVNWSTVLDLQILVRAVWVLRSRHV